MPESNQQSASRGQAGVDATPTPLGERSAAASAPRNREGWASQEEYNQYTAKKKQADEFHAKGYEARKKSDYQTAI